ncbi:MAG: BMP family ABC transporter substrate-binding protein [Chloroflexota bacterium]
MRRNLLGSAVAVASAALLVGGSALAQSPSAAAPGSSPLKIGVVTDVGTLDDKNFNEFSWNGAQQGAQLIGAAAPDAIVTTASADYAKNIQTFVDQGYDIIVTIGFALGNDTRAAAEANPDIHFIGVDQFQCYPADAEDTTCSGTPLPNFQSIVFNEAQPGYLAGIVAASLSKTGTIAALGGSSTIPPVVNYLRGYQNGALSVNPNINVNLQYVSDDLSKAFNDPAGGTAFAEQFMQQVPDADIIFAAAGKTGNGMLQAICSAKAGGKDVWGIGVDVDQYLSTPDADPCLLTSAEKKLSNAVSQLIVAVADGTDQGGNAFFSASNDGIGLAPFYDQAALITPEIQSAIDTATAGLADGSVDPCAPNACQP